MIRDRIKWGLKRRARRWAGRAAELREQFMGNGAPVERVTPEPIEVAAPLTDFAPEPAPVVDASSLAPGPDVEAAPEPEEGAMTMASVEAILDDMIRPALQSDGGDCVLLKVEDDNVYLKLIGACVGCPSSTITLRMGIETVLKEEFPQMKELIPVEHGF